MNAGDVMSKRLVAIRGDAPLAQALKLMLENRISGLPILDELGRPVGILTEGDLLRRVEIGTEGDKPGPLRMFFSPDRLAGDYVRTHGRRVSELMATQVITVEAATPLAEVAERMRTHHVKRLPVTRHGVVVGIVSRTDLVRALSDSLERPEQTLGDAAIQGQILKEFDRHAFLLHRSITVSVIAGVVELDGIVFDMRQRDAAQVVAENVDGVRSVENRLVVVDATSGMIVMDPAIEEEQARTADEAG